MNQGRIWTVVKPTVGLPLLLGSVTLIAVGVHYAVPTHNDVVRGLLAGQKMKAPDGNVADAALNANQAGFVVSVAPAGVSDKGATSFVVTVVALRSPGGCRHVSGPSAGQGRQRGDAQISDVMDVRRRGRAGGARRATGGHPSPGFVRVERTSSWQETSVRRRSLVLRLPGCAPGEAMNRISRAAIGYWIGLGSRFLPFADAATPDLPLSRLLRLSLFQVSVAWRWSC